ncbi:MAG TPA: hypothetical protein VK364_09550 [Hymenobacter sp.]|nr:hypothetical protein [Hymenobacter sp.]
MAKLVNLSAGLAGSGSVAAGAEVAEDCKLSEVVKTGEGETLTRFLDPVASLVFAGKPAFFSLSLF